MLFSVLSEAMRLQIDCFIQYCHTILSLFNLQRLVSFLARCKMRTKASASLTSLNCTWINPPSGGHANLAQQKLPGVLEAVPVRLRDHLHNTRLLESARVQSSFRFECAGISRVVKLSREPRKQTIERKRDRRRHVTTVKSFEILVP